MDKCEYQINSRVTLTIETITENTKIAHLGPVFCTSDTSTVKASVKIGVQDVEGAIARDKLQTYLRAGFGSFFGLKVAEEHQMEIEKKLVKTQELSIEHAWALKPVRCRKVEHEIFQRIEKNLITVSKKSFLNTTKDSYKYDVRLPYFDINQLSEPFRDSSCDGCTLRTNSNADESRPGDKDTTGKSEFPLKFVIVGEKTPGATITFPADIEVIQDTRTDDKYLYISVAVLNISFLLPLKDFTAYRLPMNKNANFNDYVFNRMLSKTVKADHIDKINSQSSKIDGVAKTFIGTAKVVRAISEERIAARRDHDIYAIYKTDTVVFGIRSDALLVNQDESLINFLDGVVGIDILFNCFLVHGNNTNVTPPSSTNNKKTKNPVFYKSNNG